MTDFLQNSNHIHAPGLWPIQSLYPFRFIVRLSKKCQRYDGSYMVFGRTGFMV